jgi:hypothetical protein
MYESAVTSFETYSCELFQREHQELLTNLIFLSSQSLEMVLLVIKLLSACLLASHHLSVSAILKVVRDPTSFSKRETI